MKISQILSENEKEFENFLVENDDLRFILPKMSVKLGDVAISDMKESINSFLLSSQINLIKGLIEGIEEMNVEEMFAEQVLQNVIDYLKEGIKV